MSIGEYALDVFFEWRAWPDEGTLGLFDSKGDVVATAFPRAMLRLAAASSLCTHALYTRSAARAGFVRIAAILKAARAERFCEPGRKLAGLLRKTTPFTLPQTCAAKHSNS